MDDQTRKNINDNLDKLVEITHHIDEIIDILHAGGLLNEWMVRHLNREIVKKEKTRQFYQMLQGRGPQALEQFSCAARATKNDDVLPYLLKGYKVATYACSVEGAMCSSMDELDIGWSKSKTRLIADGNFQLFVKKHPENKFMDSDAGNDLIKSYRMRSKPRGHALLINIMNTAGRDDRPGSDKDMDRLKRLFKDLGYQITSRVNLTDHEIREEVAALKADPGLSIVDSLVVFFMGHGRQNKGSIDLIASNGEAIDSDWLISEFQSSETGLPYLKDKPKMFFFQACRVTEEESSRRETQDFSPTAESPHLDTIMGFSTQPRNNSMRDPTTGSWFVEIFCDVIAENAWKYHLEDIWKLIDMKMRAKTCSKGDGSTELVKRSFNKRLYFNPHL